MVRLLGALRDRDAWLLIFDNAEVPAGLARYLPGGGGQVVITSRNPGWHELATPVGVDVFDRGESITLLLRRPPDGTVALRRRKRVLAMHQAGRQDPSGTLETPTNRTSEGLSHGFWASEWSRSGEPIAQCNSALALGQGGDASTQPARVGHPPTQRCHSERITTPPPQR
jgi:hypothetical protein